MAMCPWQKRVERWVDNEATDAEAVARHVDACEACAKHARNLRAVRESLRAVETEAAIHDHQFPAFLAGVRDSIERPSRRSGGVWALASLSAAALIVAVALFAMFSNGPQPAVATTEVESVATDIQGATVDSYASDNGSAVVWVNIPDGDI